MRTRASAKHKSDTAFLDMTFIMSLAFAFLFVIAFMLIKPPAPPIEANTKLKAEFILTMTWPDGSLDDIDMWVLLPNGERVSYARKDYEYLTLDRDDRGGHGDTYSDSFGSPKKLVKTNKEMITIRAIVPGRYVVAAHVFAVYDEVDGIQTEQKLPYQAQLELVKINPRIQEIAKVAVDLDEPRQQKAFIAFTVDEDGSISSVERDPPDEIVVGDKPRGQ